MRGKEVFTTGEVAKLCNVAPRTVSKWFDSGKLRGYRIPGSKDRRIPLDALMGFMQKHQIPMEGLGSGQMRVLICDDVDQADGLGQLLRERAGYEVHTAADPFSAGLEAEAFRPHALLINLHFPSLDPGRIEAQIRLRPNVQTVALIGLTDRLTEGQSATLRNQGFEAILRKPFTYAQVVQAIELALSPVW
jgi:excisionase family DNA binding protein